MVSADESIWDEDAYKKKGGEMMLNYREANDLLKKIDDLKTEAEYWLTRDAEAERKLEDAKEKIKELETGCAELHRVLTGLYMWYGEPLTTKQKRIVEETLKRYDPKDRYGKKGGGEKKTPAPEPGCPSCAYYAMDLRMEPCVSCDRKPGWRGNHWRIKLEAVKNDKQEGGGEK
jgi:hypothetical protein